MPAITGMSAPVVSDMSADTNCPNIYIIGGVNCGGSLKFTQEFLQMIPHSLQITKKNVFSTTKFKMTDILVVQQLFADITPEMICTVKTAVKCRVIINIHDFTWFDRKKPPNAYLDHVVISDNIRHLFKSAEIVIHPSQFTVTEYSKYLPSDNFIISPHIDFMDISSTIAIPPIVDNTIRIGCMHAFDEYKGSEYITYLKNTYSTYKNVNVQFVITGKNIPAYNENDFFNVIKSQGLHCLLLLNKWGETYCYSLSKYLKSGLPILYNAIGAPAERIPDIPAYKKVFTSVVSFNAQDKILLNNKFTEMLDFIVMQPSTPAPPHINLGLSLSILYKNLFTPQKMQNHLVKTIFVLSSTIKVSSAPISYMSTRSIFSSEQRLQQTINSINIIRYKIPDVAILLVDPSPIPIEWRTYLESIVDKYIDCSGNKDIFDSTNSGLNKGVAECKQLLASLDFIADYPNATSVCKLSGRYTLTNSFDMKYFAEEKIYFKLIPKGSIFYEPVPACYTFFYKVPRCYLASFREALQKTILIGTATLKSIETILPFQFESSIVAYDAHLGISGQLGPTGAILDNVI